MNKTLLPILARLHSLQVVARVTPTGERLVASRSDPNPITVVLREINETILARQLRFTAETGASLTLEVAGRRILRVVDAVGLPEAETCLAAPALENEHKDDLIKLLLALAQPRQEIRVHSAAMQATGSSVSVGLPIALIADLVLADLNGLDAEVSMEAASPTGAAVLTTGPLLGRFAKAGDAVLLAWLILGGPEDGSASGPEEMVDHLRAFLTDERSELETQLSRLTFSPDEPVCIALGANLAAGHSIFCARAEGGVFLGLAEGNSAAGLMPAWSAALR